MSRTDLPWIALIFALILGVVAIVMLWDSTLNPYSETSRTFAKSEELQARAAGDLRRSGCLRVKGESLRRLAEQELERPGSVSSKELEAENARLDAEYEECAK